MTKRRAPSREGMIVTTIALAPDLHQRLARAALEDNAALTELVREAVQGWLERRDRKGGTRSRR